MEKKQVYCNTVEGNNNNNNNNNNVIIIIISIAVIKTCTFVGLDVYGVKLEVKRRKRKNLEMHLWRDDCTILRITAGCDAVVCYRSHVAVLSTVTHGAKDKKCFTVSLSLSFSVFVTVMNK